MLSATVYSFDAFPVIRSRMTASAAGSVSSFSLRRTPVYFRRFASSAARSAGVNPSRASVTSRW
jgi:hypothetical protein